MKINEYFFRALGSGWMIKGKKAASFAVLSALSLVGVARAEILGETNIKLSGTIVAFSCNIDINDKNKSVDLGSWPTLQLNKAGDRSPPRMFTLSLTGCPAGNLFAVFNGKQEASEGSLLALSDSSTAQKVAIEIQDESHKRIPLGHAAPSVTVDSNGDARLLFYAGYFILADNPVAGSANADATFTINYE